MASQWFSNFPFLRAASHTKHIRFSVLAISTQPLPPGADSQDTAQDAAAEVAPPGPPTDSAAAPTEEASPGPDSADAATEEPSSGHPDSADAPTEGRPPRPSRRRRPEFARDRPSGAGPPRPFGRRLDATGDRPTPAEGGRPPPRHRRPEFAAGPPGNSSERAPLGPNRRRGPPPPPGPPDPHRSDSDSSPPRGRRRCRPGTKCIGELIYLQRRNRRQRTYSVDSTETCLTWSWAP